MTSSSIQHLDIEVDKENVTNGVKEILQILRPQWDFDVDVAHVEFTEGFANKMLCYFRKDDPERNDGIIMRVHLLDWEALNLGLNRTGEMCGMQIGHHAGVFPQIYCTFQNGICYKYFQGSTLDYFDLNKPDIITKVAKMIYKFNHADYTIPMVDMKGEPTKMDTEPKINNEKIKSMVKMLPETTENPKKKPLFDKFRKTLTNDYCIKEFDYLDNIMQDLGYEYKLCHGDVHPKNIILNRETGDMCFVDMECTHINLSTVDLSKLFGMKEALVKIGMISPDDPDITPETRQLFLRSYLEGKYDDPSKVSDDEVEMLDIRLTVMEISNNFKSIPFFFSDFELPTEKSKNVDMNAMFENMYEKYKRERAQLEGLHGRYLELKKSNAQ